MEAATSDSASSSGLALDVEAAHAGFEREAHLFARLADAREHHLGRAATGGQHALQLAGRDDVEAAACFGQGLQHGEARIGLHRIADQVRAAGQCALVAGRGGAHRVARVDVERRAEFACQRRQRALLDPELLIALGEKGVAGQGHRRGAEAGLPAGTGKGVVAEGDVGGGWTEAGGVGKVNGPR
jgi:hypothetical protein